MDALEGMSFEEVTATMRAMVVTVRRMTPFLQAGHTFSTYGDWQRFYAVHYEAEMDKMRQQSEELEEFYRWKKERGRA